MAFFTKKFESIKQDWETPQHLFDALDKEFNFQTDLAASKDNAKCKMFLSTEDDALSRRWEGACWLNPPYGCKKARLSDWIKKAFDSRKTATTVMLIPARTNTSWWMIYVLKATEIRFIVGRPKFNGAKHGLPQPLALVVFGDDSKPVKVSAFQLKDCR